MAKSVVTQPLKTIPFAIDTAWWRALKERLVLSPQAWDMAGFAVRTWAASMLALYTAFALQLESPYWSWLTVWIVAQGTPGMTLSKALYRVVGTIAGSILGIILIALFAQTPELFVLALALLVGGCTVLSNTLTNFRAYATVLAAYTAAIVASDAINAPDQVFFIAMARSAAIIIGIISCVLVTSLFAPHRAEAATRKKLLEALQDAARRAAYSWQSGNEERLKIGRKLIIESVALDTMIEFSAAESGTFRMHANYARSVVAHIFSVVSARRALDAHLIRRGWPKQDALDAFHEVILAFFHQMPELLQRGQVDELIEWIRVLRQQLSDVQPEQENRPVDEVISERLVIDRMDDLLVHFDGAIKDWRDIEQENWGRKPRMVLNFHRDLRAAWINGLRAFIAVAATGVFWIASAWTSGPGSLVFVSVLLSIFSTNPHPDQIGWTFFRSSIVGLVVAIICKYYFLTSISGFDYLTVVLALFLLPLGFIMANPSTAVAGISFAFVFLSLVGPTNPMTYDLSGTLNTGLATTVGILFGTLAYILVFPPDPAAARRYVTYRIRRGLAWLAVRQVVPETSCDWETRMYDRVIRLNDPQNRSATTTDAWLDAGLDALTLGNEILRLRRSLADGKLPPAIAWAIAKVNAAFIHFLGEPELAVAEARKQIKEVALMDPGVGQPGRLAWVRVLGALEEVDYYLAHNPLLTKGENAIW